MTSNSELDALRAENARLRIENARYRAVFAAVGAFLNGEPSRPPVTGVAPTALENSHD